MSIPFRVVDTINVKNFITQERWESIYQVEMSRVAECVMRQHTHTPREIENGMQIKFRYKLSLSSWWVHSVLPISHTLSRLGHWPFLHLNIMPTYGNVPTAHTHTHTLALYKMIYDWMWKRERRTIFAKRKLLTLPLQ